jgi:hypothetical protein
MLKVDPLHGGGVGAQQPIKAELFSNRRFDRQGSYSDQEFTTDVQWPRGRFSMRSPNCKLWCSF